MSKQLIPPDITGKGSLGPGTGASVLEHRFGESDPFTLGVEEEYQLLDGSTFDLVQHIDTVLAAVSGHELEGQINPELMQSVLEIATPVCHTPADIRHELTKLRSYVCGVARDAGCGSALPALIRSACSSVSESRRRTDTGNSSTSSSTSPVASSSSGCTSTSPSTAPTRRSR